MDRLARRSRGGARRLVARHHAADEQALAAALRAIEGTLSPSALRSFRTLLSRGGDLGARAVRLRDVDAELAIIASAREIARHERVQSEPPLNS